MPLREMPSFVFSHKEVLRAVICSLVSCAMLIVQLVLMQHTLFAVVFDVIVPFTAAVTFGCYAITMAMDRPFILIMPPTAYFLSLLIHQLFSVEVGVQETYPIFTVIEILPAFLYCVTVATGKLKKTSVVVLKIGCVILSITCVALIVLAFVFRIMLYSRVSQTVALVAGSLSILSIYVGMLEQLKIAGTDKAPHRKRLRYF